MGKGIKEQGSDHYKTGGVEPIDLYESGRMLQDWAIGEIISHAFRNRREVLVKRTPKFVEDMKKIKNYCDFLLERIK